MREETLCCHIGYSFRWAARILLYASSHRQDSTHNSLCYTSHGALAGMRNSFWLIDFSSWIFREAATVHVCHECMKRQKAFQVTVTQKIRKKNCCRRLYFRAYIHLRFKHAVLGHISAVWDVYLGQWVSRFCSLLMREKRV